MSSGHASGGGQHGVRFTPGPFKHNARVAAALVPSMLVAAGLGGRLVMGTLTIGAMVWYIMDAMQFREASFTAGWGTLVLALAGLIFNIVTTAAGRPVALTVLLCITLGALFLATAMWLTLQFRWIQVSTPTGLVLAFERLVITAPVALGAVIQSLGVASMTDLGDVPWYLAALLCGLYHLLGRPLVSSFHGGPAVKSMGGAAAPPPRAAIVQGRLDGLILCCMVVCVPFSTYLAIHAHVMGHLIHLWSVLLLAAIPLLYLAAVPQALWWLPGPPIVVTGIKRLALLIAALLFIVGFEGRVVFYAFTPYIKLQPPWNYIAVTSALFGFAALAVAHIAGALGTSFDVTVAGSCLLLFTTAGALAAGVPFHWLPAPLLAACGLALHYDSRSLREYGMFVAGGMVTAAWFVWHHFWFLNIRVGPMHLHTLCKLALAALVPALLLPGMVLARASRPAIGALMMVQAELLCVLEEQLFAGHAHEDPGSEVMYPPYLVLATSILGLAATQRLWACDAMPQWAAWVVSAIYTAKLSMLLLPEAYLVLPTGLLLLTAASPMYLHKAPDTAGRRLRIKPWHGLAHVLAVVAAVLLARFALFDVVQWVLMGRPSEAVLVGAMLLAMAAACVPLVVRCYSSSQTAQRLLAALGIAGLLLILLQPPMPHSAGGDCPKLPFAVCLRLWDRRHVPMHDADDVSVWGSGVGRREHWPKWLLFAAAMSGLVGISGVGPGMRTPQARVVLGVSAGALVGEYLALEVVPAQALLQVLLIATSIMVVAFITLLQNQFLGSPTWLPALGVAWLLAVPFTLTAQAHMPLPDIHKFRRLFPDAGSRVEAERLAAVQAALLGVFAAQALLLAFALKLKASAALHKQDAGQQGTASAGGYSYAEDPLVRHLKLHASADFFCGVVPANVLAGLGKAMNLEGPAGVALRRLGREGLAWVPTAGNLCVLLAFGICLWLNMYMTEGTPEAVFMLAPLLLLLSQDPFLLRQLGERQRYFPPVLAVTAYLTASALEFMGRWAYYAGDASIIARNGAALLLALVPHALFLHHLWTQRPARGVVVLSAACPAIFGLVLSQVPSVNYLAMTALVMVALQFFSLRHMRQVGMKMV